MPTSNMKRLAVATSFMYISALNGMSRMNEELNQKRQIQVKGEWERKKCKSCKHCPISKYSKCDGGVWTSQQRKACYKWEGKNKR